MRTIAAIAFGILALLPCSAAAAAGPTKIECIHANEDGQDQRRAGHFAASIDRFEFCAVQACPSSVRKDCATRLEEARSSFPRIEFDATDSTGNSIANAKLQVDGTARDSTVVNVEPGDHDIKLVADGYEPLQRHLHLNDGEKVHQTMILRSRTGANPPASSGLPPQAEARSLLGPSQRLIGIVTGGVGVAALTTGGILGLIAKSDYDAAVLACGGSAASCRDPAAVRDGGGAHSLLTVSTITMVLGVVLLAGGISLFLLAPRSSNSHTARLARPLGTMAVW